MDRKHPWADDTGTGHPPGARRCSLRGQLSGSLIPVNTWFYILQIHLLAFLTIFCIMLTVTPLRSKHFR